MYLMSSPKFAAPLAGRTMGSTANSFVVAEWRDGGTPPGSESGAPRWIAPLHLHHHDDEVWYVVEGKLCVKVGEDTVEAEAGAAVMAPRETPHTYWNPGPGPVRYLLIMTPTIWQLIEAIHATEDRSGEGMRKLFREFDSELL
jgi:mannose-6-phosphate isomerase-like protein (cupin superfamily)